MRKQKDLNDEICGLVKKCPVETALDPCPFARFRKMDIMEAIKFINEMPYEDLHKMMDHHRKCQSLREKKK